MRHITDVAIVAGMALIPSDAAPPGSFPQVVSRTDARTSCEWKNKGKTLHIEVPRSPVHYLWTTGWEFRDA